MPKKGDICIWVNQGTFLIWFDMATKAAIARVNTRCWFEFGCGLVFEFWVRMVCVSFWF